MLYKIQLKSAVFNKTPAKQLLSYNTEQTNTPTNPAQQDTSQAPNKGKHPKNPKYKARIKKSKPQATDPSTTIQPSTSHQTTQQNDTQTTIPSQTDMQKEQQKQATTEPESKQKLIPTEWNKLTKSSRQKEITRQP